MRFKKIITSIFLILNIVFISTVNAYAVNVPTIVGIGRFIENLTNIDSLSDVIDFLSEGSFGLIPDSNFFNNNNRLNDLDQYITGKLSDNGNDSPSESDKVDYFKNQFTINDDSVVINNDMRSYILNLYNDFVEDHQPYCYSFAFSELSDVLSNVDEYNAIGRLLNQETVLPGHFVYMFQRISSGDFIYKLNIEELPYLYFKSRQSNPYVSGYNNFLNAKPNNNGTFLTAVDIIYKWDSTNLTFNEHTNNNLSINTQNYMAEAIDDNLESTSVAFWFNWVATRYRWFPYGYDVVASDILYQPYYYNDSVWQDFSSSTGDYTLTNNNINTVNYGDITSYIDSYNTENGVPPSVTNIDNHIETTNNENITNNNGPGGDGDSDDDDNNGSGILGILSRLGTLIGNLIVGIGQFLTGIVEGLVTAVTNLLSSLTELITGTLESLTNIFSSLISFVYDGLPDEIQAVLILALSVSLLITIIKLIRGN